MRQALHIFRKDARGLRWEIAGVLIVILILAILDIRNANAPASHDLNGLFLGIAIFLLTVRVIQSDALTDDREFWLTRPYSRLSLLAAKVMFAAAFIVLPMAIADIAIVQGAGFSMGNYWGALAWEQVLLLLWLIIPFAALAAVTSRFYEALLALVLVYGAITALALTRGGTLGTASTAAQPLWIETYLTTAVMTTLGSATVLWQYATRRAWVARGAILAAILGLGLNVTISRAANYLGPRAMKSRVDLSSVRVTLAPPPAPGKFPMYQAIRLPFRIHGLPDGALVEVTLGRFIVGSVGMGILPETTAFQSARGDAIVVGSVALPDWLQRNYQPFEQSPPVRVHLQFNLTVLQDYRTYDVPLGAEEFRIPGAGICRNTRGEMWLNCRSAFRGPGVYLLTVGRELRLVPAEAPTSRSPFPADFELRPIVHYSIPFEAVQPGDYVRVIAADLAGSVNPIFDQDNVKVQDYEGKQP